LFAFRLTSLDNQLFGNDNLLQACK